MMNMVDLKPPGIAGFALLKDLEKDSQIHVQGQPRALLYSAKRRGPSS